MNGLRRAIVLAVPMGEDEKWPYGDAGRKTIGGSVAKWSILRTGYLISLPKNLFAYSITFDTLS